MLPATGTGAVVGLTIWTPLVTVAVPWTATGTASAGVLTIEDRGRM
jgi:hypothetical protein